MLLLLVTAIQTVLLGAGSIPLIKSVKDAAVRNNTAELIASGRTADQAYAIAKDVQRDARKLKKPSGVKS